MHAYSHFHAVPSIIPNISVLPAIDGQHVSLTISVDVSFHTLVVVYFSHPTLNRLVNCVLVNIQIT